MLYEVITLSLLKGLDDVDHEVTKIDQRIQVKQGDRPVLAFHDLSIAKYKGDILIDSINSYNFV